MRIARPKPPETSFRRKRAPPPQATRFLLASLATGLIFVALLAVVFVPRGLDFGNQIPTVLVELRIATEGGVRILVNATTAVYSLSEYGAVLTRDNETIASLGPGLAGGSVALAFVDYDADGRLDPGDSFPLSASIPGSYRFEIFFRLDRRVGFLAWDGALG